jgi:Domain of unknown function DUF11
MRGSRGPIVLPAARACLPALLVLTGAAHAAAGTPMADLRVSMSDGVRRVVPGQRVTYEISVYNAGPDAATGASVSDVFVPFIAPGFWTCAGFSGATCTTGSGIGFVATTVNLPVGGLVVFNASATVAPNATGLVTGTAISFPPGGVTDPDIDSNRAADTDNVTLEMAQLAHGYDETRSLLSSEGAQDYYWISQEPFASYEVIVDAASGDIGGAQGPELDRLSADATLVLQSADAVGAGHSRSLRWRTQSGPSRVDDEFVRVRSADCATDCGLDDVYRIRAYETTYSIARFNNGGSQVSVLLLHNPTTRPVLGTLYFWVASGAPIATYGFNVAPRASLTLNTSTVVSGQGGTVTVTNDAPYAALTGKIVSLEPSTGYSFDTPMLPRPR